MLANALLALYRNFNRHKLYGIFNVVGLATGVGVFLVLFLLVRFELSYDRWIPNADQIYRIDASFSFPGRPADEFASSPAPLLPALLTDYPRMSGARAVDSDRPVSNGSLLSMEHTDYVDPNFFSVLALPLVRGTPSTALSGPDDVVITEAVAGKYFAHASPIGRQLTLFYHGVAHVHTVTGVLKNLPENTQFKFAVVAPLSPTMENDPDNGLKFWGNPAAMTFVRIDNPGDAENLKTELPKLVARRAHDADESTPNEIASALRLTAAPLTSLHFGDAKLRGAMKVGADIHLVYALALMALLTLLVAICNYVNLATAQSALRAKEIAVRKVLGATTLHLRAQLLSESAAYAILATLMGLGLAEIAAPFVNALGGASIRISYLGGDSILPWAGALAIFVGVAAGLYPAVVLSKFKPAPVLASAQTPGGGRLETTIRGILIGLQFAIAIVFTISTLVIGAQAEFIRTQDRGYRREGVIVLDNVGAVLLKDRQNEVLDAFRRIPGVVSATATFRAPGLANISIGFVRRAGQIAPPKAIGADVIADQYLQTFGAKIIAGRMFDKYHGLDDVHGPYDGPAKPSSRGVDVIINESAVRVLGFKDPRDAIGKTLQFGDDGSKFSHSVPIIGVMRDMQLGSPQNAIEPVVYHYDSQSIGGATGVVRYAGVSSSEMIGRLQAVWSRTAPTVPFLAQTGEDKLRDYYVPDQQRARIFTLASCLAVGLGCVGLYGLASFNTTRRYKEIGIRKTLGASTSRILILLIGQFLKPVVLANLVAWPVAYVVMRSWLANFDQRIFLNPLYFLAASVLTLAIALSAIVGRAYAVARAEPAKALRNE